MPSPISKNQKGREARFVQPYKELVCSLFVPSAALQQQNHYINFTVKLFLNYFINKKIELYFGRSLAKKISYGQSPYLFALDQDMTESEREIFARYQSRLHELLDHYYSRLGRPWFADVDLLGKVYNEILYSERIIKKKNGQFFTPKYLVKDIVAHGLDFFDKKESLPKRVLDPAGGGGIFLNEIYRQFFRLLQRRGWREENIHNFLLDEMLWSFDIDAIAVHIMRVNLSFLSRQFNRFPRHIFNKDFLLLEEDASQSRFDWVVGNPPWGGFLSKDQEKNFRKAYAIGKGEINTYTLFLEKGVHRLRQGGLLSFLVPQSLLNIRAHRLMRRYLLEQTRLDRIVLLGDVFHSVYAPAMALHVEKQFMSVWNKVTIENRRRARSFVLEQDSYRNNPYNIFSVETSPKGEELIALINRGGVRLNDIGEYYMGIVTGNNKKYLKDMPSESAWEPIITGPNVRPFYIDSSYKWIYFQRELFQQAPPREVFLRAKKLLYKFISSRLIFALDRHRRYHLNSINGYYLTDRRFLEEYVLAVMNSHLINYYFGQRFFTHRILQGDLNMVPIVEADMATQMEIRDVVNRLMESYEKSQDGGQAFDVELSLQKQRRQLEEMLFELYKIPSYLQQLVNEPASS